MHRRRLIASLAQVVLLSALPAFATPQAPPLSVLVLGDSQAQGLAAGLERMVRHKHLYRIIDRTKIATGLVSPRVYDWPAEVKQLVATEHADVAIIMFGANDRPPIRINGQVDAARSAVFQKQYGSKVSEIAETLANAKIPVIWVGHPIVSDPTFSQDMTILNGIYAQDASAAGAEFFPTWTIFAGPDGNYNAYGKDVDGMTARLRADDGVHLTPTGYDLLATDLLPDIASKVAPPAKIDQPAKPGPSSKTAVSPKVAPSATVALAKPGPSAVLASAK